MLQKLPLSSFQFKTKFLSVIGVMVFFIETIFSQTCDVSFVPPANINGVEINSNFSGSVSNYPSAYKSCSYTTPANAVWLGAGGRFSYTMSFSKAVNNVVIVLTATGTPVDENFIFTTSSGNPTISSTNSCFSRIVDNQIFSGYNSPSVGGGGIYTISNTSNFTSITIYGSGGANGTLLSVCSNSINAKKCKAMEVEAPKLSATKISSTCFTSTVNLNNVKSSNLPDGLTLTWHKNLPASNSNVIDGNNVGAGKYFAAFYDKENKCYSTNSSEISVKIISNSKVFAGPDLKVCKGNALTLNASGSSSYSWDNGVFQNTQFYPSKSATYSVTATDTNGCESKDELTITLVDLPKVDAGISQIVCENTSIVLKGTGAKTYIWDNGVIQNVAYKANQNKTYSVTGIDENGCKNTDTVQVKINLLPKVDAGIDLIINQGEKISLNASGAKSYRWDNGVLQGELFVPDSTKLYTVIGTDSNGCVNSDKVLVSLKSFEEQELENIPIENLDSRLFKDLNLVFVLDVSNSMANNDKMNLMKLSILNLLEILRPQDKITLVSYSSNASILLPTTTNKELLKEKISDLKALGYTAGSAGIKLGFKEAKKSFIKNGTNLVVVITDGAFSKSSSNYLRIIEKYQRKNINLSVVGIKNAPKDEENMREASKIGKGSFIPVFKLNDSKQKLILEIKKQAFKY